MLNLQTLLRLVHSMRFLVEPTKCSSRIRIRNPSQNPDVIVSPSHSCFFLICQMYRLSIHRGLLDNSSYNQSKLPSAQTTNESVHYRLGMAQATVQKGPKSNHIYWGRHSIQLCNTPHNETIGRVVVDFQSAQIHTLFCFTQTKSVHHYNQHIYGY